MVIDEQWYIKLKKFQKIWKAGNIHIKNMLECIEVNKIPHDCLCKFSLLLMLCPEFLVLIVYFLAFLKKMRMFWWIQVNYGNNLLASKAILLKNNIFYWHLLESSWLQTLIVFIFFNGWVTVSYDEDVPD